MNKTIARVAFAGSIGSGKTAISDLFVSRLGYTKLTIAHEIRIEVSKTYGIPIDLLYGSTKEQYRPLLIEHGERRRKENKAYWIRTVLDRVRQSPNTLWVIDDLRFRYESKKLNELGFITVKLDVPKKRIFEYLTEIKGLTPEEADGRLNDSTELELRPKDVDYMIPVGKTDMETYTRVMRNLNNFLRLTSLSGEAME